MQITAKEIIPVIKLLPDSALYHLLVAQAQVIVMLDKVSHVVVFRYALFTGTTRLLKFDTSACALPTNRYPSLRGVQAVLSLPWNDFLPLLCRPREYLDVDVIKFRH